MKDILKFKTDLEPQLSADFTELSGLFDALENEYSTLSDMLKNSAWQGVSNLQCRDIHDLIIAYEQSIRPISSSLKNCCADMLCSVDSFCADSRNVISINDG